MNKEDFFILYTNIFLHDHIVNFHDCMFVILDFELNDEYTDINTLVL